MDILVGDILKVKKQHPCGGQEFAVLRIGMDFKIRCLTCGREVMLARSKIEKNIRRVVRDGKELDKSQLVRRREDVSEAQGS